MPAPAMTPMQEIPLGYTHADLKTCNDALRDLAKLEADLAIAKEAGIPCDEQCKGCRDLIEAYQTFKRKIFPRES